jgi:hypothetical protein
VNVGNGVAEAALVAVGESDAEPACPAFTCAVCDSATEYVPAIAVSTKPGGGGVTSGVAHARISDSAANIKPRFVIVFAMFPSFTACLISHFPFRISRKGK